MLAFYLINHDVIDLKILKMLSSDFFASLKFILYQLKLLPASKFCFKIVL